MRINIIPPKILMDQHLVAEYREIKMLPKAFLRSFHSKHGIDNNRISDKYTLNKGHGFFFYNKIQYIIDRFELLKDEMIDRGFACNFIELPVLDKIPLHYKNNYLPTLEEQCVNIERILLRISEKSNWYKFRGIPVDYNTCLKMYSTYTKSEGKSMTVEIDYNGSKVNITLTEEQIKEAEKQALQFNWKFFPGCYIMDFNINKIYNNNVIEQECVENGVLRLRHENARKSLKRNKRANRLEALVEQLGYDLIPWGSAGVLYYIYQNYSGKYQIDRTNGELQPEVVYMTEECAFKICELLNFSDFSLEGDS